MFALSCLVMSAGRSSSLRPSRESTRSAPTASATGITVWNGLFIVIGFYASHSIESANMTILGLSAPGCPLVAGASLFCIGRRVNAYRKVGTTPWKI